MNHCTIPQNTGDSPIEENDANMNGPLWLAEVDWFRHGKLKVNIYNLQLKLCI